MNIGNDGRIVTLLANVCHNRLQILALATSLRRQTNNGRTGIGYTLDLLNALRSIGRWGVGHRLYGYRMLRSYLGLPDTHLVRLAARKFI